MYYDRCLGYKCFLDNRFILFFFCLTRSRLHCCTLPPFHIVGNPYYTLGNVFVRASTVVMGSSIECVFACQIVCRSGMCDVLVECFISYDRTLNFVCVLSRRSMCLDIHHRVRFVPCPSLIR